MPVSSLLARLRSLHPLKIIEDRIKGTKSRLGVGLSGELCGRQIKDIAGGVLVPQSEDLERVAGNDYRLVIGLNEL